MPAASEIEPVTPSIWLWRAYDSQVKAELFSTAISTASGLYVIDPIDLAPEALAEVEKNGPVAGIVVTNENHDRAADAFATRFGVPVHRAAGPISEELIAISIDGGPSGEMAVHHSAQGGTLIVGDALINFEPYGFTLLPAKYCSDARLMRRSLPKLLDYPFERILFAHGLPILSRARERLEDLLRQP